MCVSASSFAARLTAYEPACEPCVVSMQTATRWERQLCRARMELGCFDVSFSNGAAVEAPGGGEGSDVQVWGSLHKHWMPPFSLLDAARIT